MTSVRDVANCPAASLPTPQFTLPFRPFSATAAPLASSGRKKSKTHDPYVLAQQKRKKAALASRRADLEAARTASLGDPIRGNITPFVESFATGTPLEQQEGKAAPEDKYQLNYAFDPKSVKKQLRRSKGLVIPLDEVKPANEARGPAGMRYETEIQEPLTEEAANAQRAKDHERAAEAIKRITALENGSSKDRMRANIARCVQAFGRHQTDLIFPSRAPPLPTVNSTQPHPIRPETNAAEAKKRIGPDTGSSEVQVAILTAKINTLADFLESRGKNDKHNKRNLRLLVHRRQKLLQYLRRKERGGPRWQHCIETLGLTEGTWKGEITL